MPAVGDDDVRTRHRSVGGGASTSLFARVKPEYETTIIAINGEFPFLNGHS